MSNEIEAVKETAKATQEVAKATGKGIDAGREVGGFISRIVGGTLEQGAGIWEDKLRYRRIENQLNYIQEVNNKLRSLGLEQNQVENLSMKLAIPLLEAASLEDNDALGERWANLTVNAVNAEANFTLELAYINVLDQMTELEADILIRIYSHQTYDLGLMNCIETARLPISVESSVHKVDFVKSFESLANIDSAPESNPKPAKDYAKLPEPSKNVKLALSNLARLQCVKLAVTFGEETFNVVHPTIFGERLYEAVTLIRRS